MSWINDLIKICVLYDIGSDLWQTIIFIKINHSNQITIIMLTTCWMTSHYSGSKYLGSVKKKQTI